MYFDHQTDDLAKILWDYNYLQQPLKNADAILVLGSHDIRVATYAAELYLQGYAPLIIFTGDVGRLTKGLWKKPEAQIFADEAMKQGVPEKSILLESKSTNTGENILFAKKLIAEKSITVDKILLVQKPYMLRRAFATCKKIWPEISVTVTAPDIAFNNYPNVLVSKEEMINIMVGDTQRIKEYSVKGFQIEQKIPENVWYAFEELVKRGYTHHLIK